MANGTILLEVRLRDAEQEEAFFLHWREVRALLSERFRLIEAALLVLDRGRYLASLSFPLPGAWRLIQRDRRWRELEAQRPPAEIKVTAARPWRLEGPLRDISTAELRRWVTERRVGQRDFALVDTRSAQGHAEAHLPGAVSLPTGELDEARVRALLGEDRRRPVVVYCSDYG